MNDQEVLDTSDLSFGYSNFSIILTGNQCGKNEVYRSIACDDTEFEIHRAEQIWNA